MKTIISIMPHLQGGGVERVVNLLSDGLVVGKNANVHIITTKPYSSNFPVSNLVKVHNLDLTTRTLFNLRLSDKQKSKLIDDYIINNISENPDLILCHQDTITRSMRFSVLKNIYHVIHSNLSNSKLNHKSGIDRLITKIKLINLYRNKPCISVSQGIMDDAISTFKINNNRCIHNAVDEKYIIEQANHPISNTSEYLLHVGNFTRAKRHDRLVEAYIESNIETPLHLIGSESDLTDKIRSLIASHNIENKVIIHGFMDNPYPWIANAKGLILSSDFEGLPMILIEALALGTPIISTNCKSGPSEIVGNHIQCLSELNVSDLAKKIIQLDQHPCDFKVPLQTQFSIKSMVEKYYELI